MNSEPQTSPPRPARRPGLAAAAFLSLVLGFAAACVVLIVGKTMLADELPFRSPSRLVLMEGTYTDKGEVQEWPISQMDFADWRKENSSFEQMAVYGPEYALNLGGPRSERLNAEVVSHDYFPLLGAGAEAGRFFLPEEDQEPFRDAVAVLSHDLWQRCCGGDPEIVGRTLELNGRPYTVVGVAAEGFRGISDKADLWIPSMMPPNIDALMIRRFRWVLGAGMLKPGVTLEQAQQDLDRITAGLEKRHPDMNRGMGVRLVDPREHWFGEMAPELRRVAWATALLLLFAVATAAILLRGEASAGRTVLLTLAAAILGLVLATWAVEALAPASGLGLPSFARLSPGAGAAAVILGLALLCGLAIGLASRVPAAAAGWRVFQGTVVAVLIVLAVFLGAKAFRTAAEYRELVSQDLGFRPENLLTLRVDPRGEMYKEDPPVIALVHKYLDRLSKIEGVKTVGMAGPTIPTDNWAGGYMTAEERDNPEAADGTWFVMLHAATPGYFEALGVPVVQGAGFGRKDEPFFGAIVGKGLAERNWPGQNPLGKRFKFGVRENPNRPWRTVIGVVPDFRQDGYKGLKRPAPDVYVPMLRFQVRLPLTLNVLVKSEDGMAAESLIPVVEREMRAIDPSVPPYDAATMEERLDRQVQRDRLGVRIAIFFALSAAALAVAAAWGGLARRGAGVPAVAAGEPSGMPAAASR